jgi:hypothetical protein
MPANGNGYGIFVAGAYVIARPRRRKMSIALVEGSEDLKAVGDNLWRIMGDRGNPFMLDFRVSAQHLIHATRKVCQGSYWIAPLASP